MPRQRKAGDIRRAEQIADRLHSAAIHVLRRVRHEDEATGLSAPRLSALSVIVFAGPITLGRLAAAEGVRPPTMTRLVQALETDGLVTRATDPGDARFTHIRATARGRSLLATGRRRRVAVLAREIAALSAGDRAVLARAATLMEQLADTAG
ncbi:MAG TPA: MarR family transcriptional regulator [Gemmatimonadaceae bacterium]|nr:MarR family transcriptional regulator [Gemmatimonadaceae bacterium]